MFLKGVNLYCVNRFVFYDFTNEVFYRVNNFTINETHYVVNHNVCLMTNKRIIWHCSSSSLPTTFAYLHLAEHCLRDYPP